MTDISNNPSEVYEKALEDLLVLLTAIWKPNFSRKNCFQEKTIQFQVLVAIIVYEYYRRSGDSPSDRDTFILNMVNTDSKSPHKAASTICNELIASLSDM